jgi:predicted enzyme related to lactoylglutathione lyase
MAHGEFAWNELLTRDMERARAFYGAILGWEYDTFDVEGHPYWVAKKNDGAVAGIGMVEHGPVNTMQAYWLNTVEVDDVDAATAIAASLGAAIIEQPHDVPNIGRFAALRDPNGAVIGMLQGPPAEDAAEEEAGN